MVNIIIRPKSYFMLNDNLKIKYVGLKKGSLLRTYAMS
ncbi:hypothetical protein M2448_003950 [Dysgonomonas sp. PF1-14]|nr:hypothetical protein [Dysgonomonas sp. PF1-14]MDH6340789.1 hypothetical protein [Dysgonomonas sp. PF1-16]MDH6399758.1 hypothetical protein [Dysgonomonas sp. PF1-23]